MLSFDPTASRAYMRLDSPWVHQVSYLCQRPVSPEGSQEGHSEWLPCKSQNVAITQNVTTELLFVPSRYAQKAD